MRVLLQVVKSASVEIEQKVYSSIGKGFLLLVGYNYQDDETVIKKVMDKVTSLRVFVDEYGKMNLGLNDVGGEILLVSQFTLYADYKKGRRPSFNIAARGEVGLPLYEKTCDYVRELGYQVKTGVFGADMKVSLINDGPTTIMIDSEEL